MILTNFVDESDIVLVGVIGKMGKDAANIVSRIAAKVYTVEAYAGRALDYNIIEAQMIMLRPKVLFIVHGENSTGVLQPLERIGQLSERYVLQIAKKKTHTGRKIIHFHLLSHDCILIVDAVHTLGAVKLLVDDWKIDVAYGSSQNGLGGSSGIVSVTYSSRAMERLKNRKTQVVNALWDMKMLVNAWQTYDESKIL